MCFRAPQLELRVFGGGNGGKLHAANVFDPTYVTIKNEVDLILNDIEKAEAQKKFDRDLIKFSQDIGVVKKEKEQKYLTIDGLLNHPYFVSIKMENISIVIDEFEKLLQPNYDN